MSIFKSEHEKDVEAHHRVIDFHFGELIDWNIQTSIYQMLFDLLSRMDETYLISLSKVNDITDVSIQLEDAILEVLKDKKIEYSENLITLRKILSDNRKIISTSNIYKVEECVVKLDSAMYYHNLDYSDLAIELNNLFNLNIDCIIELKNLENFSDYNKIFIKYSTKH